MKPYKLQKTSFRGSVTLPSSKSHTMRALLLASLAKGTSYIRNPLYSPDTQAMIRAVEAFGAVVTPSKEGFVVSGVGRVPEKLKALSLDAGNSGQVLRFASAFYAQSHSSIVVTGDHSLQTLRPCTPLVEALIQLGASVVSSGCAPLHIQGPIKPGICSLSGVDSQPVSALLLSLPLLQGTSQIDVIDLGERPWIELTLDWMRRLGLRYQETPSGFLLPGGDSIPPFERVIPGDLSSLAFPLILGIITDSEITIRGVDCSDVQGDKAILDVLVKMGARFSYDETRLELNIEGPQRLVGIDIDVNSIIDALPALAVLACFAEGTTRLTNCAIARKKESDRIHAMAQELSKMGAQIVELPDGLEIVGRRLKNASLNTYHDHRIALALACSAFATPGISELDDISSVAKSFPDFFEQLERISV